MPGLLSTEPASDGPASTKAKARMKLIVRIDSLRCPVPASRRVYWRLDSGLLFPDICAPSGKWFRRARELFRGPGATKQWDKNTNDFRGGKRTRHGASRLPAAAIRSDIADGNDSLRP